MSSSPETSEFSDYELWVRRLYETNMFHPVKLGLQNIDQLHSLLGSPTDDVTVIHIAGTNGKGSVALKIATAISKLRPDLRVGLFCSPHVSSFRERMQILNEGMISEEQVVELLPPIYQLCREHEIPATFFEITTALAFSYFRTADVIVLETGLGGRLDATNVVKKPALSVITSIGLEHTRILGDTVEKIAVEKGGIIKENCPVLVGPNVPHETLRQCAKERRASKYWTCEEILGGMDGDTEDYNIENSRIACAALKLLHESHPQAMTSDLPSQEELMEVTSIRPPCRFEEIVLNDGKRVILDVAHNPPAMNYLVRKLPKDQPVRMIVGMSSDKDLVLCGKAVREATSNIHLVQAAHPRAAKLDAILEANPDWKEDESIHYNKEDPSVTYQVKKALELVENPNEILVVCGSVFLMAETREALGIDEPRDSPYIAAMAGAGVRFAQENFGDKKQGKGQP